MLTKHLPFRLTLLFFCSMIFLCLDQSCLLAGNIHPDSNENTIANIFGNDNQADFFTPEASEETPFPVGPAMLFAGIILLAAAGRQYAGQYHSSQTELLMVQSRLEALIDDSVTIERGQQYEDILSKVEQLNHRKAEIERELLKF